VVIEDIELLSGRRSLRWKTGPHIQPGRAERSLNESEDVD
jgi:hypothetical protein